jgi:hypothetical protein
VDGRDKPGHDDREAPVQPIRATEQVCRVRAPQRAACRVKKTPARKIEIRVPVQCCLLTDSSVNPSCEKYSTSVFRKHVVSSRHPASIKRDVMANRHRT